MCIFTVKSTCKMTAHSVLYMKKKGKERKRTGTWKTGGKKESKKMKKAKIKHIKHLAEVVLEWDKRSKKKTVFESFISHEEKEYRQLVVDGWTR